MLLMPVDPDVIRQAGSRQSQVWLILIADERVAVQEKLKHNNYLRLHTSQLINGSQPLKESEDFL